MRVLPYLTFNGNCEEALKFYAGVFGGETEIMRFGEMSSGDGPPVSEVWSQKVMHASLAFGGGAVLYLSDTWEGSSVSHGDGVTVHVDMDSEEDLRRVFSALSPGGTVTMPVDRMFWGAVYGSLVDKFGINWGLHFEITE
jgi:PhnB protein